MTGDLRAAARRRRDRRFAPISVPTTSDEQRSADELKRRLDETQERLRQQIPPQAD
jgi:hypothetical protein